KYGYGSFAHGPPAILKLISPIGSLIRIGKTGNSSLSSKTQISGLCCSPVTPQKTLLREMSALGQKRTSEQVQSMSALPPKADIGTGTCITFDAATPAAWGYSPQSAALHP